MMGHGKHFWCKHAAAYIHVVPEKPYGSGLRTSSHRRLPPFSFSSPPSCSLCSSIRHCRQPTLGTAIHHKLRAHGIKLPIIFVSPYAQVASSTRQVLTSRITDINYKNGSRSISNVLVGKGNSKCFSTVGCKMPNVPMRCAGALLLCGPHRRRKTAAEWPERYIGSAIGGGSQCIRSERRAGKVKRGVPPRGIVWLEWGSGEGRRGKRYAFLQGRKRKCKHRTGRILPSTSSIQYPSTFPPFSSPNPSSRDTKAARSINMTRSSNPCTCSNPLFFPYHAAAKCRSFRLRRSARASCQHTSPTSKIRIGTRCPRFSRSVFSKPGTSDVRTIWYSAVLGLARRTQRPISEGWLSHA